MTSLFLNRKSNFIRASFSNRGLSRVINKASDLDKSTLDSNSILRVADTLKDVKIETKKPTSFSSIPEMVGIDYIGYVIEKERLDKSSATWIRLDEFRIVGSDANNFKDSRVAYDNLYRYRMKSIIKVTLKVPKDNYENLEFVENIREIKRKEIKEQLELKSSVLENLEKFTSLGIKPKKSSGKQKTVVDILSDLKLEADAARSKLVKIPTSVSPQSFRNFRMTNKPFVSPKLFGKISKQDLQKEINEKIVNIVTKDFQYVSFYYESNPNENWRYVKVVENVPPPPPSSIQIVPNTPKNEICVNWLKPSNRQRDIKGFKVYRRESLGESWKLVKQSFSGIDNIFIDKDVNRGNKYIYAISSVDAHGIESFLSVQIQAELNSNFFIEKKEKPLKWISGSGLKPSEIDISLKKFKEKELPIVAKKNVVLGPKLNFKEPNKKILVRITSLDTHEKKEFNVTLKNVNIRDVEE